VHDLAGLRQSPHARELDPLNVPDDRDPWHGRNYARHGDLHAILMPPARI
jgi:hypothetical protein